MSLPFADTEELPQDIPSPDNPIPFTIVNSKPLEQGDFLAPYVPVNPTVAEEALKFAKVTLKDVLADLGCGDARILIKSLETIGNKCVAVELDPYLIEYIQQTHAHWIQQEKYSS